MKKYIVIILGSLLIFGCAAREPSGKPVELTQEEKGKVKWAYDEKQLWAAWPKKFDDEKGSVHQPEPADTLLKKASVFLRMNEPKLAIKYFEKFNYYRPGTDLSKDGIEKARAMMAK